MRSPTVASISSSKCRVKVSVLDRQIVSPLDLEKPSSDRRQHLPKDGALNQLFLMAVIGFGQLPHADPQPYCGSAAHPGGGVMGIAGYNVAGRF